MKYYLPMRCPGCGLQDFSPTDAPEFYNPWDVDPKGIRIKWAKCNTCEERIPIPRNHIVKE